MGLLKQIGGAKFAFDVVFLNEVNLSANATFLHVAVS
jgi:hypothetical protein